MVSMLKSSVKFLSKLLILPIAMIALSSLLHFYYGYDLITSAQIAIAAVGFLAIMWIWASQIFQRSMIEKLSQGIHDHETSIVKRINTISANTANVKDVEKLEKQVAYVKKNLSTLENGSRVISADDINSPRIETHTRTNAIQSDDAKVIPLEAAKRKLEKQSNQDNLHYSETEISDLIEDGRVYVHLQPKVFLLDNSVCGFEVLARLKDSNDRLIPACQFIRVIKNPRIIGDLDIQVLEKTIELLRTLRRKGQKPVMHVNLSAHSFSNQEAFDRVLKKLSSNKSLKTSLILEVAEKDFSTIISKHSSRINKVMKTGFRFCVDNCQSGENIIKYMKSGVISAVKINANTFHELDYWASLDSETNLTTQAKENGIKLVITHVEKKRQVIQLIDSNVEIAQGFLFSEPKPPASGRKPKKASMPQAKAVRR